MKTVNSFVLIAGFLFSSAVFADSWIPSTNYYCPSYYTHSEDNYIDINYCDSEAEIQFPWNTNGYSVESYTYNGVTSATQANYSSTQDIYCSTTGYAPGYTYLEAYSYMEEDGAWSDAAANWG